MAKVWKAGGPDFVALPARSSRAVLVAMSRVSLTGCFASLPVATPEQTSLGTVTLAAGALDTDALVPMVCLSGGREGFNGGDFLDPPRRPRLEPGLRRRPSARNRSAVRSRGLQPLRALAGADRLAHQRRRRPARLPGRGLSEGERRLSPGHADCRTLPLRREPAQQVAEADGDASNRWRVTGGTDGDARVQ